ncbi:Uncharacterized protein FWK35_00029707, partial [Aphis craccivora]
KQIKPNPDDFIFYSARKLGNKTYTSFLETRIKLTKVTYKSEFSSTEEENNNMKHKRKIKCPSLSPNVSNYIKKTKNQCKPHLSDSCPPRYIPIKEY